MSESVKTLIESMREAVQSSKTARDRIKTADEDQLNGTDLLVRTIQRITEQVEETAFPDEVRQRKEAAKLAEDTKSESADAGADAGADASTDDSSNTDDSSSADDGGAGKTTTAKETKLASLPGAMTLLQHPLVRKGFDDVLEHHQAEVRDLVSDIAGNVSITV